MTDETNKSTVTDRNKTTPIVGEVIKVTTFNEFILWAAMPYEQKKQLGLKNQKEFAEFYSVRESTLSDWKDRPDYEPRVSELRRKWGFEKTGDVLNGIYRSAIKGNPYSQQLWLNFMGLIKSKEEEEKKKSLVEVTVDDIRFLIRGLPEDKRQKHYENLRDLLIETSLLGNPELLEAGDLGRLSEKSVQSKANIVPQAVPGTGAGQVSHSHPKRLSHAMVGKDHPSHYQSTAWWWQK